MNDSLWSDEQFRAFLSVMRGGILGPSVEDGERGEFLRQARVRLAPEVQRRVLRDVGATVDAYGVAVVAFELIEESAWDRRRAWLMASTDPWRFLTDLVVRELVAAYGETAVVPGDEEQLQGILTASTRPALEAGSDDQL